MLTGGYVPAAVAPPAPAEFRPALDSGEAPALVLDFTPRGGSGLFLDDERALGDVRLEMSIEPSADRRMARLGFATSAQPSWLAEADGGPTGFILGGAAHWSSWSLGGGYGSTEVFGERTDLVAATFGYGSISGSLAYGEVERDQDPAVDMLMLSTDLVASRWLTLESDVALGSSAQENEDVAVGRLGVRLNF